MKLADSVTIHKLWMEGISLPKDSVHMDRLLDIIGLCGLLEYLCKTYNTCLLKAIDTVVNDKELSLRYPLANGISTHTPN